MSATKKDSVAATTTTTPPTHSRMPAPPGSLVRLDNKLCFCVISLTDDENDPRLGHINKTSLPAAEQVENTSDEQAQRKALVFSSHCTTPQQLFTHGFLFNKELRPRADVCGVVFDKRDVDAMTRGDVFFDDDQASGNLLAAFVMPSGWNDAKRRNELCHHCGAFPARVCCEKCGSAHFCGTLCYVAAMESDTHTSEVCDNFIKARVAAAMIRQYNANTPAEKPRDAPTEKVK